ncbi:MULTISPECIES: M4 family metallopeptidase [Micromonospora]|uniref:Zn-dependent metalloprotease n=1 Tax=Micromonospora rifamycinica TaxID=291594 RepID=A0A120F8K2_9ACTN|nr:MULTISPECIES: M4 family metallopeptidase [Micromonospora]KWV31987.1 zinc metalloprotease [Micromonospora rifamycinica]WFE65705.1 M4 family metallopeptidase [Micromonospora sp. WMMD714]SCG42564.1 Zn-dependent metalloprotease [Micromonospora rifamycinica]
MKLSPRLVALSGAVAAGLIAAGTTAAVQAAPARPAPDPAQARATATGAAAALVASRPGYLHASADDAFVQRPVISSEGIQYVPFERTYKGLAVIGGDFVLATTATGEVSYASVAQQQSIGDLSTTPRLTATAAERTARALLRKVTGVEGTTLVVHTLGARPALAWETTVTGTGADGPSRLTVDVDAVTGVVLGTQEHVMRGTGTGAWNGPVTLATTQSGSTYSLKDPGTTNLSCQDAANNTTFSGPDDVWGNGTGTSRETGCVDALFSAQTEHKMLSQWLGRNGANGSGGAWPIRVGLNDQNAYYDGSQVQIGKNTAGQWIGSLDVVAHEIGHGIDDTTPGGISRGNTQEFVADTFGAATEWFANEPSTYDAPDFLVGEKINLVGSGPIRNMYNPSALGDANCYSSSIPGQEVHAAAGPGNHWFYLLAMGSNPTNGQPTSPTCNSSTVTGLGIQKAIKIMYNAMLIKTTSSSYLKYRTWTLQAAKTLYPGSCTEFNTVKAAWDAVSVPAQSADPTCTGGTPTPTPTATSTPTPTPTSGVCSGQKLTNPGFESGGTGWTATSGVITSSASQAAHGGSYKAWLNGYGSTHTDTVTQSVAIPAGCRATLSFWLHIDTAESGSTAYDKLTVKAGGTTLATYSNVNAASGYVQRSFDVSALAGGTVTISFSGVEDSSLQTSFVVDDTALTLS